MKKTLSVALLLGALMFGAVPAFAQSEEAAASSANESTDDDGSDNGLWGLLGLPGLLGLIKRRRNDDNVSRGAGASRATLAVLGLSTVLVLGTASGVLAQSEDAGAEAGAAIEEVEGDGDQGIDGRWGLLGLLGLFGLFGYRNDKDRDTTTTRSTTTSRPTGSTQAR